MLAKIDNAKLKNTEIIIVNDCSKDRSLEIIQAWISRTTHDVVFISHERNRGKGAGIKSALKIAKGEYFVVQDADLEYNPIEIPNILAQAHEHNYPVVYGSRFLGTIKDMPKPNYYANRFYNYLVRVLYGVKITDMHTCYKMMKTNIFKELNVQAEGFGYAPEVIAKLIRKGIPIHEVPISFEGRTVKDGKKIDVADGIECLTSLIRYRFMPKKKLLTLKRAQKQNLSILESQLVRFLIVGVGAVVFNTLALYLAHGVAGMELLRAQLLSSEATIIFGFIIHHNWTYRRYGKKPLFLRFIEFNFSALGGAAISTGTVILSVNTFGLNYLVGLLIGAVFATTWNYFSNLYFVWNRAKRESFDFFDDIQLHLEAKLFTRYLIRKPAESVIAERYVKSIRKQPVKISARDKRILHFSTRHPWSIKYIDAINSLLLPHSELRRRLYVLLAILEASTSNTELFLPKNRGRFYFIYIIWSGMKGSMKAFLGLLLMLVI
ncbi:MAG: hypothetical protein JWM00_161 [Candidatus Saccharibacteria bacterium]|nr:hypothetical protein [Candidatus Saccharibacteria bacterium]